MRQPPPLRNFPDYPVTGGTILFALAVSVPKFAGMDISAFILDGHAMHGQPWRFVTSTLPHGDVLHLAFNLLWTWSFGTLVEEALGGLRTAMLFVLFAVVPLAAEFAILDGGIGLSGVGYGLFGLLWILSTRNPRFLGAIDPQTVKLFIGWFFFCVVATKLGFMNVANIAHGVGALCGILAGLALSPVNRERILGATGLAALTALTFAGAGPLRPVVNVSPRGFAMPFELGVEAYEAKRFEDSARFFEEARAMSPNEAATYFDLGLALEQSGRREEAGRAFLTAVRLAPDDEKYRDAAEPWIERAPANSPEK